MLDGIILKGTTSVIYAETLEKAEKQKQREYYQNNKEELTKKQREYYENNKEEKKEKHNTYYENNKK